MTVALFIAIITTLHLVGYAFFVYWCTKIKPEDDTPVGEVIGHSWDGIEEINNNSPTWVVHLFYAMIVIGTIYMFFNPGIVGTKWNGLLGKTQIESYQEERSNVDNKANEYFAFYNSKTVEELLNMPEALKSGQRIYLQNCAVCHTLDAQGVMGYYPNLTDSEWLWGGKPENIIATITNGRNTVMGQGMPAGGALPDPTDQVALTNVADYVLQLGGHKVDAASAEAGKALYDRSCIACHGADGKGNALLGAPNIANDIWLYAQVDAKDTDGLREFLKQQIVSPVNNTMPAWSHLLDEARIKVVAAYIYSLSQSE